MVIKEHKNFLPEKEFLTLRDTMQARQFPWYLTKYVVDTIKNDKDMALTFVVRFDTN